MKSSAPVVGPLRAIAASLGWTAAILAAVSSEAHAGEITIERSTFGAGGGVRTGSGLEVTGTLAQPVVAAPTALGSVTLEHGFWSGASGQACPADLNADGIVNTPDLTRFLGQFGSTCPQVTGRCADFNLDGIINVADLVFFLGRFGRPCQ